ncbi:MAG: hypothetical protein JWQ97_1576 [Phenylobacterium sp.]|nr:hypothetical protein [Phenylobacterium sp.]
MSNIDDERADYPVDPIFADRWSRRSFTGEPIARAELMSLLNAARLAPSAFNIQPWRFVYAQSGGPSWPRLLGLLSDYNQTWARHAAALVILVTDRYDRRTPEEARPSYSHSFDAGAAWAYLALQAHKAGWSACCMTGFDIERAHRELAAPSGFRVEAAIAIGRPGEQPALSESFVQRQQPSTRLPLSDLVFEGGFPTS